MTSVRPLVCDLDGTLILADTTYELCIQHIKRHPFVGWLQLLKWFSVSKSQAKSRLAIQYAEEIDPVTLPYTDLLAHEVVASYSDRSLVSGSHVTLVQKISDHVGGFSLIQGADGGVNLIGQTKANYLLQIYPNGFDYVGDSRADIPVWQAAQIAYAFNASSSTLKAANAAGVVPTVLSRKKAPWQPLLKGMRLHQWSKNALLAVLPLLSLSHAEASWILLILIGFLAFGLVASGTYLLNDLLDIQADRAHPTKSARAFASGALSIPSGIKAIVALATIGFMLALAIGESFTSMLLIYVVISVLYSFHLKSIAIFDVIVLSLLFCWRILSGSELVELDVNTWLMLSMGFFFLSLALGKRAIELTKLPDDALQTHAAVNGRDYYAKDLPVVISAGVASGFATIVIVLIYALLSGTTIIEREISAVLIIIILTFWQMRFWLLVVRKQVNHDPVVFALKDRMSLSLFVLLTSLLIFEQIVPLSGAL